jgi:hypothetical protein
MHDGKTLLAAGAGGMVYCADWAAGPGARPHSFKKQTEKQHRILGAMNYIKP